ncbi:MAG: adenosine kinase, partial [Proteobacteria bacterium]|nr:adenosine kinase [Pseudomonadota bacterium]
MKLYDVVGLGNSLVDILLDVSDAEFASLALEKGTMRLVSAEEQQVLLDVLNNRSPSLVSGGSVANSIIALAQLGGKGALCSSIGDDRYGLFYLGECESLSVDLVNPPLVGAMTGTSVVLVTPDSERTMRTCLAASQSISPQVVPDETVALAEWLFVEGYIFSNSEGGQAAIQKAIAAAKNHNTKIALTCSEAWVVETFGKALLPAVAQADLVFCNETEALALSGASTLEAAFESLSARIPNVVVTAGARGAWVRWQGESFHIPAFACEPR